MAVYKSSYSNISSGKGEELKEFVCNSDSDSFEYVHVVVSLSIAVKNPIPNSAEPSETGVALPGMFENRRETWSRCV